jgi:hypothetical protein
VGHDYVHRADGRDDEDRVDGAAKPESRELSARNELAGVWLPGVGEHVESLEEATLGMRVEVGGASVGGRRTAARRPSPSTRLCA